MKVIKTEKLPIKMWLSEIEEGALKQAKNLANLPFAFHHIAIMPDAHIGYGMPIGGVLATRKFIIPNAVGVDIGCGVCAIHTSLKYSELSRDILKKILGEIRKEIPLGFTHHKKSQNENLMPVRKKGINYKIINREFQSALKQIGTLGGGNHFIEIQKDQDGFIWIMVHSGSRNLGKQVADYYNRLAKGLNRKNPLIPENWDLAYLDLQSKNGQEYFFEMQYAKEFALNNRKLIIERIKNIIRPLFKKVSFDDLINISHNYAAIENNFVKEVIVHRKGATQAFLGQIGIIPGSQGTTSYLVSGLGNPQSFKSCSHGAGRKMGRKQAIKELDLNQEKKNLDNRGIIHAIRGLRDLDEAPGAYKDIEQVIENQKDLVKILTKLEPLAVVKG